MTTKSKEKSLMLYKAAIQSRNKKKKTIPNNEEGLIPGISISRKTNNVLEFFFCSAVLAMVAD